MTKEQKDKELFEKLKELSANKTNQEDYLNTRTEVFEMLKPHLLSVVAPFTGMDEFTNDDLIAEACLTAIIVLDTYNPEEIRMDFYEYFDERIEEALDYYLDQDAEAKQGTTRDLY